MKKILSFVLLLNLLVSFFLPLASAAATAKNNSGGGSSGFIWLCKTDGGVYRDDVNTYRCTWPNGDATVCSKTSQRCTVCVKPGGKGRRECTIHKLSNTAEASRQLLKKVVKKRTGIIKRKKPVSGPGTIK